jgi:hypothetical protein
MEEHGLIDRSKLLGINGRSRKVQLELARRHDLLKEYFACGGCLLTDASFAKRLKDYFDYNERTPKMKSVRILKYGRHFRYQRAKIIVGRNEVENHMLTLLMESDDLVMETKDEMGPTTIIQGNKDEDVIQLAAELTLRYSDYTGFEGTVVYGKTFDKMDKEIFVKKVKEKISKTYII